MKRPESVICSLLVFSVLLDISEKYTKTENVHGNRKSLKTASQEIIYQFVFSVLIAREGHKILYCHCHMVRNRKNDLWWNKKNPRCRFHCNLKCRYLCSSNSWWTKDHDKELSSIQARGAQWFYWFLIWEVWLYPFHVTNACLLIVITRTNLQVLRTNVPHGRKHCTHCLHFSWYSAPAIRVCYYLYHSSSTICTWLWQTHCFSLFPNK